MEHVHVENQLTRMDIVIGVAGGIILGGAVRLLGFMFLTAMLA